MLYNNNHEKADMRVYCNNRPLAEFEHRSYPITGNGLLKEETNGCLDPRKIDYFEIVQRSGDEEKHHRSARVYIGNAFSPLSRDHEKHYPSYFKQELEEKIGYTGDVVMTANHKTIPLRSTDRVIDDKGNYVYPAPMSGLQLPFSYKTERQDFLKHREKFIQARWHDRQFEYYHTQKKPIIYNFVDETSRFAHLAKLSISSEDYETDEAKGHVYINLGGAKMILNDPFFEKYGCYYKNEILNWNPYGDSTEISEGPYHIGQIVKTKECLQDQKTVSAIQTALEAKYGDNNLDRLEDFMIFKRGQLMYHIKDKAVACSDKYMDIKAINKKMFEKRAENFLQGQEFEVISASKIRDACVDNKIEVSTKKRDGEKPRPANKDLSEATEFYMLSQPSYFVN